MKPKKLFGMLLGAACALAAGGGWIVTTYTLMGRQGVTADEVVQGEIHVERPWARATVAGRPAAAYFAIRNTGAVPDRLIALASPVAGRATLNDTEAKDGVTRTTPATEGLSVSAAGGLVILAPGARHVMLTDLRRPLREGDRLPLVLGFEKAGEMRVEVPVLGVDASGPRG